MNDRTFPERLDRKAIYESKWVSLYTDKVRMPDGHIIESYHQIRYPNDSVCVVIVNEKDEILLIQSKRYTTGGLEWEIPAGGIDKDESPEDAARRECVEETGCTLKDLTYLCWQNPNNGMSDLKCHVFLARVESESQEYDTNEVRTKEWIPKDKVLEMLKNNEIHCGVSMLGLLYATRFSI